MTGNKRIDGALEALAATPDGQRHNKVQWCARFIAGFVVRGEISRTEAANLIAQAARAAGVTWTDRELRRQIGNGLNHPDQIDDAPRRPAWRPEAITMPPAPIKNVGWDDRAIDDLLGIEPEGDPEPVGEEIAPDTRTHAPVSATLNTECDYCLAPPGEDCPEWCIESPLYMHDRTREPGDPELCVQCGAQLAAIDNSRADVRACGICRGLTRPAIMGECA